MKRPENNKWLDNALTEAIGAEKVKPNFEKWQQNHPEAIEMLTSLAGRQPSVLKHPHIIWRTIYESPISKVAAAAVIIIGLGIAVSLIDKATTPTWAIDQSIEAMRYYNAVYFSGVLSQSWPDFFKNLGVQNPPELAYEQVEFEMWAQANRQRTSSAAVKLVCPDLLTVFAVGQQTYVQLADGRTYDIQGDFFKIDPWPTTELLYLLKDKTGTWNELSGTDADTGKDRIFITCSSLEKNKSWWLEFDSETKLLVRLKQWQNSSNEGIPEFDIWRIVYYKQLPDEMFDPNLPDDADVVEVSSPLYDPNYGMSAEGLNEEQACRQILQRFWRAVAEGDYKTVRRLMPFLANHSDEQLDSNLGRNDGLTELVEMGPPRQGDIGPIVPCTLRFKNGRMAVDMIIMFREIDGQSSCVVHSNYGSPRQID